MADKFNPSIIDDALEELEEVEVVRKPPRKELVIEETLIIDDKTPAPAKEYDLKRSGTKLPPPRLCHVWFQCPKCGISFERYGADLSDIKFGTCRRCGYSKER